MNSEKPEAQMHLLEKALQLAIGAHLGQRDRSGQPYILHPLRVMMKVQSLEEKTVAVLHDVVEDTSITLEELRSQGFPEEIVKAVDCLTKRDGEPYDRLIERALCDPLARPVKLADLEDNSDIRKKPGSAERKRSAADCEVSTGLAHACGGSAGSIAYRGVINPIPSQSTNFSAPKRAGAWNEP